jgi:hypothetical protein
MEERMGRASALAFLRAALASAHDPLRSAILDPATARELDGDALRALIARERIGPLLHRALGQGELLSPATFASLRESYRATAMRNLILLRELGDCLERLASAGIATIVLKGAALARPVYGSLAVRPMVDLDILVHRGDWSQAQAVIEDLGFSRLRLEPRRGAFAEFENEVTFAKPGTVPIDLDLHWSLLDSPFYQREMAMEWFWETARAQPLGGPSALTLGPEALLLHLSAHLMLHHRGGGLLWWTDVAEVLHVEGAAMDWDEVFARCRAYQLLLCVGKVLTELAANWSAPVPTEILRRFAAARPSTAEVDLFRRLTTDVTAGERFWTDLRGMDWRQALHFARVHLLPSAAYMRRRYEIRHRWLLPAYYPYRWIRGLRGAARGGLSRVALSASQLRRARSSDTVAKR